MSEEQVAEVSAPQAAPEVAQSVDTTSVDVTADWRSNIPEEIRSHRSLEHINDVGALAKSYVHAQSMIGADKVAIPGKHATPDEWNEVYAKLGRPQDPSAYEFAAPEGFEISQDVVDWFRQAAHQTGLTSTQAAQLFQAYNEMSANQLSAGQVDVEQYRAQTESALRQEYGQAFDDRLNQGYGVVEQFGNPDIMEVQLADGTLLGDHPEFIKMVGEVGNFIQTKVGEDTLEGVRTAGGITPDEAQQKLSELRQPSSPFWDARHPEHHYYVEQAMKYQEMIHS